MNWLSLVKQIPTYWKQFISDEKPFLKTFNACNTNTIIINGKLLNEAQLDSKLIYSSIVSHKCAFPKNRLNLEYKYGNDFEWCGTCSNIYKTTIDNYSRAFQFKIVHNILSVNKILYNWKVSNSDRCLYCFLETESLEHLFCHCNVAVTLYRQIQQWAKYYHISLPDMNVNTILYGISPCSMQNALINHIILIYKQILFNHRNTKTKNKLMAHFVKRLNDVRILECNIARTKNKSTLHNMKWRLYNLKPEANANN